MLYIQYRERRLSNGGIIFIALATDDDIMACDPEGEYGNRIRALGGEVIKIAAGSPHHINAMDMVEGYGDGSNPVIDKSEFVLSLFEQFDPRGIDPHEKSIIDRCVDAVYREYKKGGAVPTLQVLRKKLLAQPEEEAQRLALSLELFTSGSLNAFAHETNVDILSQWGCLLSRMPCSTVLPRTGAKGNAPTFKIVWSFTTFTI